MRVLVTASARFATTNDGQLWTENSSLAYNFWTRYLDAYDEVYLLVRTKPYPTLSKGWHQVSGPGLKPIFLPDVGTPLEFIKNYRKVRGIIQNTLAEVEAVQLRLPCFIGAEVWRLLERSRPYGVEVVGDPYDVFASGSVKHPLRPVFQWWFPRDLKRQCAGACASAYVTEYALQDRYPPAAGTFSTHYSSIDLPDSAFIDIPRSFKSPNPIHLITVGTLDQYYKAPDILLDAVASCVQQGLDLKLVVVGDGKHRVELEQRATDLGLQNRVHWCGHLSSREAVIAQLDQAHLFVLPSRQEGLPRAMIEAMARGLPCIGSQVGGIPELLPTKDLVPPGDVSALAAKIREITTDPARMTAMSTRNWEKAREYRVEVLRERRIALYRHVKEKTEDWLKSQEEPLLTVSSWL